MATAINDSIKILDSQEAENYIDSTMSTQRANKVSSPAPSGKKRSFFGEDEASPKKVRAEKSPIAENLDRNHDEPGDESICYTQERTMRHAARRTETKSSRHNFFLAEAEIHDDSSANNNIIKQLLSALSADMQMMYNSLLDRIDKFEAGLEQRISNKVAQLLDRRVSTELNRIRQGVDERMEPLRRHLKMKSTRNWMILTRS